jgi:hypothetical protein
MMHIRHTIGIDDKPTTEAVDDDGRVAYRGPDAWVRRHAAKHCPAQPPERGLSLDELGELMRQGATR